MTFNSLTFVVFLALVLALHQLPLSWRARKRNLLIASYLFYAAWNPPFVLLIWISTVTDWFLAQRIHQATTSRGKHLLVAASLAVNLGLLGYFKYGDFALEMAVALADSLGFQFHPAAPGIVLPVGISFYTFQTLSYTLDVQRGRLRPWPSFLDYALYVTFFPQLVAGPIVRARTFLPQCVEPVRVQAAQLSLGLALLVAGLFQKVVIADGLAGPVADLVYAAGRPPDALSAWCGTLAFGTQIYCDFAGYTTCALGAAAALGFTLPDNFRSPYAAIGLRDFWRRWHISLSTWLRDYLYISLGGSRRGSGRTQRNVMITMLLGGLWHGASWTFVVWGGLVGHLRVWRAGPVRIALAAATFALVSATWVFFRASDLEQAISISGALLGLAGEAGSFSLSAADCIVAISTTALVLSTQWLWRDETVREVVGTIPGWLQAVTLGLMLVAIATSGGNDRAFLYFQF